MKTPDNNFWNEIQDEANKEWMGQQGDLPRTQADATNYEVLPIQELRKRAEKLKIPQWESLNKQKLIDEIRKYNSNQPL